MYAKPMMLNEKLGEQLPLHFEESVQVTELYGIEVELEGKGGIANPTEKIIQNWVKRGWIGNTVNSDIGPVGKNAT